MIDFPPSYTEADQVPSPGYPETSLATSQITRSRREHRDDWPPPANVDWTYKTEHMEVTLSAPQAEPFRMPAYGLNGKVEGYVKLKGTQAHVVHVTASVSRTTNSFSVLHRLQYLAIQLDGIVKTVTTERGMIVGQFELPVLSRKMSIYTSTTNPSPWADRYHFAIPFPSKVNMANANAALPPSFSARHVRVGANISYQLKFDMVRKGLRRHER
jgi:hypothetical protein